MLRSDVWRGESRTSIATSSITSGCTELDCSLLNGGWPLKGLIEVCQPQFSQLEWLLFTPALNVLEGLIVLLNPPFIPFVQGLVNGGIDIERVRVVRADNKADFLACFVDLTRTQACDAILAWEPKQMLSYTELRKCLLSGNEGNGLYALFRAAGTQQQSSPATLRVVASIQASFVSVNIFKQRGALQSDVLAKINLPEDFNASLPFHLLDQYDIDSTGMRPKPKAPVIPIRWGRT